MYLGLNATVETQELCPSRVWVHTQLDGPLRGLDDCDLVVAPVIPPVDIRLPGEPKDEEPVEGRPKLVGPEGFPETGPESPLEMGPLDMGPLDTGPDILPGVGLA